MRFKIGIALCLTMILCTGVQAREWIVDCNGGGDFLNISDAVASSSVLSGDTLTVRPCTYEEQVLFPWNKPLTVRSSDGPQTTIVRQPYLQAELPEGWDPTVPTPTPTLADWIDAETGRARKYVVAFESDTSFSGFTVRHYDGSQGFTDRGCGFIFFGGPAKVHNCHVEDNDTGVVMACVAGMYGTSLVEECDIHSNRAGMLIAETFHRVQGNRVYNNDQWGIELAIGCRSRIASNLIWGNGFATVSSEKGGICNIYPAPYPGLDYQTPEIYLNTIWGNDGYGILTGSGSLSTPPTKGNTPMIRDNIIVANDYGVAVSHNPDLQPERCFPILHENDVFGNSVLNYDHPLVDLQKWFSSGDISVDPLWVSPGPPWDFHLQSGTPCRDEGSVLLTPSYTTMRAGTEDRGMFDLGFHHFKGVTLLGSVGGLSASQSGETLSVSWEAPAEYEDGTPAEDLAGSKVYWLDLATEEMGVVYVEQGATSVTIEGKDPAKDYCVAVTAFNEDAADGAVDVKEVQK